MGGPWKNRPRQLIDKLFTAALVYFAALAILYKAYDFIRLKEKTSLHSMRHAAYPAG